VSRDIDNKINIVATTSQVIVNADWHPILFSPAPYRRGRDKII